MLKILIIGFLLVLLIGMIIGYIDPRSIRRWILEKLELDVYDDKEK